MPDLADSLAALVSIALGSFLVATGLRIRLGVNRAWVRLYQNPSAPKFLRNAAFSLIPSGAMLIAGAAFLLTPPNSDWMAVKLVTAVLSLLLISVSVVGMSYPPGFLIPRWFRESGVAPVADDRFDHVISAVTVLGAVVLVVVTVVLLLGGTPRR